MENQKTALSIVAHPDDTEFQCAGTLALLYREGWKIISATMTPGQAGSAELPPEEISAIRHKEAANAVALLNGEYHCLESEDIFIMYDRETLLKTIGLIRRVKPAVVFTASPSDYMVDHEVVGKITRTACLAACIPNIKTAGADTLATVPYLYYCDPFQGKDIYGKEIEAAFFVDISSTMEIKEKMLSCHKSQRDWLYKISGVNEYVIMMKEFAARRGKNINRPYAEGFRQNLGYNYPSDNVLKTVLGELVIEVI